MVFRYITLNVNIFNLIYLVLMIYFVGQSTYKERKGPKICKNKSPVLVEFHNKQKCNLFMSVKFH